ncbi:hypothetical protein D9758_016213 [Tetrapyrgos nigripes]|uniref:N-acetyltransferase domain-containing protein n=1 Tax=Tetrapyrgos nigripes TaxID=182062 RepID=A0A8H5CL97_9AGAR|nr:hypothetical protein D9758_016213 [Tetrapyrgos nigripes]
MCICTLPALLQPTPNINNSNSRMSSFSQVSSLSADELTLVSQKLANAFSNLCIRIHLDPLFRAILGEPPSSESKLAVDFFKAHILAGLQYGAVYTAGENLAALAVVFGPGTKMDYDKSAEWQDLLGRIPEENRLWYESEFNDQCTKFSNDAYGKGNQHKWWYLMVLGVEASAQNQGLGKELVNGLQRVAEESNVPLCWQTTTAPLFYQHLGFEAVRKIKYSSPSGDIEEWAYVYQPPTVDSA